MIVTFGDSVCWGQGLKEEHKFDFLFAQARGRQFTRVAHSGAIIGTPSDNSTETAVGEIPIGFPSDWQQVLGYKDWAEVELVLLNGGINDVSLTRILNPGTTPSHLQQLVDQFCRQGMEDLIEAAAAKLVLEGSRIAVLGYFPILSRQSGGTEKQFQTLMEMHGIATSSVVSGEHFSLSALLPGIINNCLLFWNSSNTALQAAVDAANAKLGRAASIFVKLPFTEANSMWAPQSLLWELTPLLLPEDEVAEPRGQACELLYGDLAHIPQWVQCARASVGHPRVEGAAKIADALLAAL